jgi:hypothetical protein
VVSEFSAISSFVATAAERPPKVISKSGTHFQQQQIRLLHFAMQVRPIRFLQIKPRVSRGKVGFSE